VIEFRLASPDVMEALVADVGIYVFRHREALNNGWRLTANALGVVGKNLGTTDPELAKIAALAEVRVAALAASEHALQVAAECTRELEARATQQSGPEPQKEDSK